MQVRRINVKTGLTINLGNYESARVDVGAEAELSQDENIREGYAELYRICEVEIADQVRGIRRQLEERSDAHSTGI